MTLQGRKDVGAWLRAARERRGLTVERVASATRIPRDAIRKIEDERWDDLPADAYIRGFLRAFARAVDLDVEEIQGAYRRSREGSQPEVLRPPPQANLKVRRAGVAVAMVILVVLLTLLLTIVLRPRRRGAPILSRESIALEVSPSA